MRTLVFDRCCLILTAGKCDRGQMLDNIEVYESVCVVCAMNLYL